MAILTWKTMTLKFRLIKGEYMGKRNIDRLRDKDDENLATFLIDMFDDIGAPLPYTLCKRCRVSRVFNIRSCAAICPYKDKDFVLEWLYSEKRRLYGVKRM